MTARTKSIVLLLSTLMIGMVLGSVITGAVHNRRMAKIADMRTARGLVLRVERLVRPVSDEQRRAIRAVLDSAAPAITDAMFESREKMRALSDSLRAELDPLLTVEQRRRLDEGLRVRSRREPFGPPGGRGPPGARPPP